MENENIKGYVGTFAKKDGTARGMRFIRMQDVPLNRLPARSLKEGKKRVLKEGTELVWDIDADGYRIFNWSTVTGEMAETEFPPEELPPVREDG